MEKENTMNATKGKAVNARRMTLAIACLATLVAAALSGPNAAVAVPEPTELCEPGYYSSTGREPCRPAPAGTYVESYGAHAATPCAVGSYSPFEAADECTLAEPGYYVASTNATSQAACSAGTFSSASGSGACAPAPAGYYVPNPAAAGPTPCPPGHYQPATSQLGCLEASAGSFVHGEGQPSQAPCAIGTYQPIAGQSSCIAAQLGYYVSTIGSLTETACPEGMTTTSPGATSQSACVPKPLTIEFPRSLPEATRGRPCSIQWVASGGTGPYVWKKLVKLPKGLKLSRTGLLSGTPSTSLAPGFYFFDVQVKDAAKHVVKARLMLGIR